MADLDQDSKLPQRDGKALEPSEIHAGKVDKLGEELADLRSDIHPLTPAFGGFGDLSDLFDRWDQVQRRYDTLRRVNRFRGKFPDAWEGTCVNPLSPEAEAVLCNWDSLFGTLFVLKTGLASPHYCQLVSDVSRDCVRARYAMSRTKFLAIGLIKAVL